MTKSPMPWLNPSAPAKPPRERLSVDAIVDAAYVVLDRDGFDKLSMRAVATDLGVAVSSLYAHVTNKEELMHHMWVRSFRDIEAPVPTADRDEWAGRLRDWAYSMRAGLRGHRDMSRVSMGQHPFSEASLPYMEQVLAFFRSIGLPEHLVGSADYISTFIEGFVYEEQIWEQRIRQLSPEEAEGMNASVHAYFASLDPKEYPNMSELGPAMVTDTDQEKRFRNGIDLIVRGLLSHVPQG